MKEMTEVRRCGTCRFLIVWWGRAHCPVVYGEDNNVTPGMKCRLADKTFASRVENFGDRYPEKIEIRDEWICRFERESDENGKKIVPVECTISGKKCTPRVPDPDHPGWLTITCPKFSGVQYRVEKGKFIEVKE